jgi:lipopolysaccharide export system permease protein
VTILFRYLLVRFLLSFFGALLVLNGVVLITETLLQLSGLLDDTGSLVQSMAIISLRVPANYIRFTFPMAGFIGVFLTLGTAARNNEVLAMKAVGVSPYRVLAPILLAAIPLSAMSFLLYETVGLSASRGLISLDQDGEIAVFGDNVAWFRGKDAIYRIRDADPEKGTLRDVRLYERNEQGLLMRSISARNAKILDNELWELKKVRVRTFDPAQPKAPSSFEVLEELWVNGIDPQNLIAFDPNQIFFSILQLSERISSLDRDGADSAGLKSQLQSRLTDPWIFFLFCLLAAPVGLDVERTKSIAKPALKGISFVVLFMVLRSVSNTLSLRAEWDAAILSWTIIGLFLLLGTHQTWKANR